MLWPHIDVAKRDGTERHPGFLLPLATVWASLVFEFFLFL